MASIPESSSENAPLLPKLQRDRSRKVLALVALTTVFASLAGGLVGLPIVRLIEDAICQEYCKSTQQDKSGIALTYGMGETACKIDAVQTRLAYVMATQEVLDAIASFAFAVPYGLVADRIGREKVLSLAFLGICLSGSWAGLVVWQRQTFPIWTIWFSTAFQIIGGGPGIPMAMIYTIVADVQTEVEKTTTLYYITVCSMITELFTPSLCATLMQSSPWLPFIVAMAIMTITTLLALFIPETRRSKMLSGASSQKATSLSCQTHQILQMFKSRPLCLLFLTFIGEELIVKNSGFGARYISKRFSWPISRYGYFMSARSLVAIILYLFVLPRLSSLLQVRLGYPSFDKDLLLARTTAATLAVGLLLAGGPVLPIVLVGLGLTTIGSSSIIICRSIATHFVDPEHVASMYTLLSLLNTAGAILASPILASTFVLGLEWGSAWQGLPYFCLGAMGCGSAAALLFVKDEKRAVNGEEEGVQEEEDEET